MDRCRWMPAPVHSDRLSPLGEALGSARLARRCCPVRGGDAVGKLGPSLETSRSLVPGWVPVSASWAGHRIGYLTVIFQVALSNEAGRWFCG